MQAKFQTHYSAPIQPVHIQLITQELKKIDEFLQSDGQVTPRYFEEVWSRRVYLKKCLERTNMRHLTLVKG